MPRYEIFPPRLTHLVSVDSSCKKQEKNRFSCTLKDGHDRERKKTLKAPFSTKLSSWFAKVACALYYAEHNAFLGVLGGSNSVRPLHPDYQSIFTGSE